MTDASSVPSAPSPDESGGTSITDPQHSNEPVGGGAESVPDPEAPDAPEAPPTEGEQVPDDPSMGGPDTVAANDELGLGHTER